MDTNGHTILSEDYCSYEVAKLLKEKGFDEPCRSYYIGSSGKYSRCTVEIKTNDCREDEILRPTLQMACKWLREVHNLHVDIGYDDLDWFWNIISISEDVPIADRPKFIVTGTACHRTYEEAVEAALKYTLENLI